MNSNNRFPQDLQTTEILSQLEMTAEAVQELPQEAQSLGKYGTIAKEYLAATNPARLEELVLEGMYPKFFQDLNQGVYYAMEKLEKEYGLKDPPPTGLGFQEKAQYNNLIHSKAEEAAIAFMMEQL